jgi:hypothetical protein
VDSSSAPSAVTTVTSSVGAVSNGSQVRFRVRDFDQTTDESIQWAVELPPNYSSGGTLGWSWLTTITSNAVVWKTAYVLIHPNSEGGSATDYDAAVFGTVNSGGEAVPTTAGRVEQTTADLGVTGAHAGDLLVVYFGRDPDNAFDLAAADARLLEPWWLSFTTV